MKTQTDAELRNFLHNALKQIDKNSHNSKAHEALAAIKAEWTTRLVKFLNNNYKADRPELGIFTTLGYHVGNDGASNAIRHRLLDFMITQELPPAGSPAYLAEWNAPNTFNRYNKLLTVLRNLSNRYKNFDTHIKAVREWREDIEYISSKWGPKFS